MARTTEYPREDLRGLETPRGVLDLVELMEGLDVGVVVQGRAADILFANPLALELLGRSRDQVLGVTSYDPAWDVVRPDGSPFPPEARPVARVLETGRAERDVVLGVRRRNGDRAWVLANAKPRFIDGAPRTAANVEYVVVTLSDISSERRRTALLQQVTEELELAVADRTRELARSVEDLEREVCERRRVEAALERSESMYRSVLRAMAEGVAIHAPDGSIEYVNPAALKVLGLTEDQMKGRAPVDGDWSLMRADGESLPQGEIPSEITRRSGRPCSRHVLGVRRGNGERAWLEVSTEPVEGWEPDASEHPWVVATFTDVTETRVTTRALERSRARFKRVTEAVPGVLYQMRSDADGALTVIFVSARAEDLLGVHPTEAVADPSFIRERIHPDDLETFRETFRMACRSLSLWECDVRVRSALGEWRWVRNRGTPERDGDGIQWSGVIMDVTEERSLTEQVQVAQRREAIGAVTAGVAHNFNNALAVLVPNLEACLEDAEPALHQPLLESLRTARSAGTLVRQLMVIARGGLAEREPGEGATTAFDVVAVTHDVLGLCRGIFQSRIRVDECVNVVAAEVVGSDAAFHQVLLNMCLNARDALHGRDGGVVEVSLDVEQREAAGDGAVVVLRVRDNGMGMGPAEVARLGEPFFTTKPPGVGTGLGLATAYAAVRDMKGQIQCASRLGEGTQFTIELPVVCFVSPVSKEAVEGATPELVAITSRAAVLPPIRAVAAPPMTRGGSSRCVLLVDDDDMVRDAMARTLARRGFTVDEASGGAEGLARVTEAPNRYGAVVLDLSMPGIPGERVLAELSRSQPQLPVVVLSGFVDDACALEDAAAVLNKPVTSAQITQVLDELPSWSAQCEGDVHDAPAALLIERYTRP